MSTNEMRKSDGTHRVVITGMGSVSPAGIGVMPLWSAVKEGRCCIGKVTKFDASGFAGSVAAEIPDFDPVACGFSKKEARRFAPFVQYAIVAADEAMAQSGLCAEEGDACRMACVWGSGIGGLEELEKGCITLHEKGAKRVNPLFIPTMIENMAAGNLSIRYGLKGDCLSIVTACATGSHCVGEAYRLIRHGYADAALAGGSEESISPICLAIRQSGALTKAEDPRACDAFRREPQRIRSEGGYALVLESLEHATARGARILAEVAGFGSTGDAFHSDRARPSGEGIVRAMRQALSEGGFALEDVGHLNAHGTSTHANDATESAALRVLLGERARVRHLRQGHGRSYARRSTRSRRRLRAFGVGIRRSSDGRHDAGRSECGVNVVRAARSKGASRRWP
ncbi:MAG: beta-ketoacyl-[acyl-carrier-protein] synthase family protein [Eggerthellaceae bacterium]